MKKVPFVDYLPDGKYECGYIVLDDSEHGGHKEVECTLYSLSASATWMAKARLQKNST